ncbi:TonB-dependent receptor [Lutibacter holmesii]|uniref:TonB-dependent receptor n=1 Tax=Lutibacter holmesii TaxID=1137985 RepID=A0ABW3WRW2_9FLAO
MRNLKNWLTVVMLITSVTVFSQTVLSGKVVDEINQPLPGATVVIQGSKIGASTDFDGNFSFETSIESGELIVSFIGYQAKSVSFSSAGDLGTIALAPSAESLDEIVITQTSFAIDRKTPVAVSTIKASLIENKLGTQEFPEILKSTPGVYATKSGGGFGDGRLTVRGFDSENVAVTINGVPVNDMENGKVYWSNWAGLSDVTSAMQVQRGLGASKLAVPSIGGTVNILSKSTDIEAGGSAGTTFGNDNYFKVGATVSTGLLESGFAATISAAKTTGDGFVDGTEFKGANYFVNLSYQINENHKIALTSFGAPQRHGQRQNRSTIETYQNAQSGTKFNPDWGLQGGNVVHIEDNFYHKSQTSLNHYWTINDKSNLSTAIYASWGRGGGGGTAGDNRDLFKVRMGGDDQPVDLDNIVEINRANGEQGLGSEAYLRASRNDHSWYGILSTYDRDLSESLKLTAGIDLRTYTGEHFSEVTDLLGGSYALDNGNVNNPNAALKVGDKRDYYNDGEVGWQGVFGQLEYDEDKISAFVSLSASNTSYRRVDYFNYLDGDDLQTTDKYNFFGFSAKGGANYRINDKHNVFANLGYFEKAANMNAVFLNYDNEHINADAENQKISSFEIGYGYRTEKLTANVNLYSTYWNDRTLTQNVQNPDGTNSTANILGVNAIHNGIELDFVYRPMEAITLTGMLSLGNWEWANNVLGVEIYDEDQELVDTVDLYIEGLKVSDAAQTTAALGVDWKLMDKTHFTVDYNYFANFYAQYDPNDRGTEGQPQAWETPDYGTFDMSLRYGFKLGTLDTTITGRMMNVFDTEYIADALDGAGSTASTALVWYGYGRTFSVSAKINF